MRLRTRFSLAIAVLSVIISSVAHAQCPIGLSTADPADSGTQSGLPNYLPGTTELEIAVSPAPGTHYDVGLEGNCGATTVSWTAQLLNCSANRICTLSAPLPAIDDIPRIDANPCAIRARYCTGFVPFPRAIGVLDRQTSSSVSSLLAYSSNQPTYSSNTDVILRDLTSNNVLQGGNGGDFICTATQVIVIVDAYYYIQNCSCVDGNSDCFSSILSSAPWSVVQWNGRNITRSPNTAPVADPTANPIADPAADPIADPIANPITDPIANPIADPAETTIPLWTPTTSPISPSLEPTSTAPSSGVSSIGTLATLIFCNIFIALMQ